MPERTVTINIKKEVESGQGAGKWTSIFGSAVLTKWPRKPLLKTCQRDSRAQPGVQRPALQGTGGHTRLPAPGAGPVPGTQRTVTTCLLGEDHNTKMQNAFPTDTFLTLIFVSENNLHSED